MKTFICCECKNLCVLTAQTDGFPYRCPYNNKIIKDAWKEIDAEELKRIAQKSGNLTDFLFRIVDSLCDINKQDYDVNRKIIIETHRIVAKNGYDSLSDFYEANRRK